jgi:CTD small phosphatase-like protein 2
LQETAKEFEVVVFTASHRCYADVVLDYLDPEHAFVHHRLYRDNCIITEGVFIKDLRILGNRNLKDIVIVDNAAYSFGYQVDNGVPIISWHDDPYDRELFNLIDYLKALSKADDIREVNRPTFHLASFYEDYIEEFMAKERKSPRARQ